MINYKIRKSTLDIILLCISFYEISIIPHGLFSGIKYAIIIYLLLSYIHECIYMKKIIFAIFLYGGITFISTIVHQTLLNRYIASFVYLFHLIAIYITVYAFIKNRGVKQLCKCLIGIIFCYLLITDVLMLVINYNFSSSAENYFVGSKFAVAYLHCFIAAIIFFIDDDHKYKLRLNKNTISYDVFKLLYLLYSIVICARVTCTTGILICIFLGALMYLPIPEKAKKFLSKPESMILVTLVINILILGSFSLLTNVYVADFIANVLGKSSTWIGRIHIYEIIMGVIKEHPFIGYGYFSDIIEEILTFGNAQNGVLKILIDSGWIGLIGYISLVYCSLRNYKKLSNNSSKNIWPLISFIYCMILASIAEINLTDYLCFLTMAIIFAVQQDK